MAGGRFVIDGAAGLLDTTAAVVVATHDRKMLADLTRGPHPSPRAGRS